MVQGECGDVGSAKDAVKLLSIAFGKGKRQDKPRERRSLHLSTEIIENRSVCGTVCVSRIAYHRAGFQSRFTSTP